MADPVGKKVKALVCGTDPPSVRFRLGLVERTVHQDVGRVEQVSLPRIGLQFMNCSPAEQQNCQAKFYRVGRQRGRRFRLFRRFSAQKRDSFNGMVFKSHRHFFLQG